MCVCLGLSKGFVLLVVSFRVVRSQVIYGLKVNKARWCGCVGIWIVGGLVEWSSVEADASAARCLVVRLFEYLTR